MNSATRSADSGHDSESASAPSELAAVIGYPTLPLHVESAGVGGDSFEAEGVTLLFGNCADILPKLAPGLVYVCDQPYGTGWVRGGGNDPNGGPHPFKARAESEAWDVWDLSWLAALNAPKRVAAFCPVGKCEDLCNALPMPAVMHYKKTNVRPGGKDREPIVVSPPPPMARKYKGEFYNDEMPLHPCQKPLDLMVWLIESVSDEGDTVVDNFMGSATTGIACIRTGRRFIGIESDRTHYETAVQRVRAELAQGSLFRVGGGGGSETSPRHSAKKNVEVSHERGG